MIVPWTTVTRSRLALESAWRRRRAPGRFLASEKKGGRNRGQRLPVEQWCFCFFLVWGICHSSKPNRGIFKEKNDMSAFETKGKIAKGRPIVLAKDWIHCCFVPGSLGSFFFSMTRSTRGFDLWHLRLEVAVQPQIFDRLHQDHAKRMWILEANNAEKNPMGWWLRGWVSLGLMILMDKIPGPQYLWYCVHL